MNYRNSSGYLNSELVTELSYSCDSPKNLSSFYRESREDDARNKLNLLKSYVDQSLYLIQKRYQERCRQVINCHSKFVSTCSFFASDEKKLPSAGISEKRKQDLINYFDETTKLKVKETEARLASVWRPKINELLLVIKEKQESSYEVDQDCEVDRSRYRSKILAEFKKKHEEFLEKVYLEDFEIKKLQIHERRKNNLNQLISQIQDSHFSRIHSLKLEFKSQLISKIESDLTESTSSTLRIQESKIRSKADFEVFETIQSLKSDLELALNSKFQQIDSEGSSITLSSYSSEFPNWQEELSSDPNFTKKQEQIFQLKQVFNTKIKQDLIEKIASETLLKRNLIYQDLDSSFATEYQAFQTQLNEETRTRIQEIEENYQSSFFKLINQQAEKALRPIEIKIKINYHKKLDLLKETIRNEMEKRFQVQFKNFKRTVELEKISLGQYKANCNVMNRTLDKELKSQHALKTKEKSLLARKASDSSMTRLDKSQEITCKPMRLNELKGREGNCYKGDDRSERLKNEQESNDDKGHRLVASQPCRESQSIFSNYISKSLSSAKSNPRPQSVDPEIAKIINRPLPPPSAFSELNSKLGSNGSNLVTSESNPRKFRIISPSMTEDVLNTLISSSHEQSSSHSRCQSASLIKTHKKYENLLSKHHGYICPRNK